MVSISLEYLEGDDEKFTTLTINGPETGVEISIDNFKVSLPSHEYYLDKEAVCDELIVNSDSSASPFYIFLISLHDPRERFHIASNASSNYLTISLALFSEKFKYFLFFR